MNMLQKLLQTYSVISILKLQPITSRHVHWRDVMHAKALIISVMPHPFCCSFYSISLF